MREMAGSLSSVGIVLLLDGVAAAAAVAIAIALLLLPATTKKG